MKNTALLALLSTLALAACNQPATTVPVAPAGQVAYGLTTSGKIATFGMDNPGASLTSVAVSGLASGEALVDIDVRNTDNRLYGVTSAGKVYVINTTTGAATADGATVTGASVVAADFNPVANRLRVIGQGDLNFRATLFSAPVPATSAAGTVTADGTFAFTSGTVNPNLASAAYTNSFDNSATGAVTAGTTTALYSVDADSDALIQHSTRATDAAGTFNGLTVVGALGTNVSAGTTGFDIAGASSAYLSSASGSSTTLYSVNLTTGAATSKGTLSGTALTSLALKLAPQ
ncbi:hypothetical protein HNQ07_001465 [Deinococcus metalli]|uniref:DUF4394 domain-containing protein n=1 Tax=Deinococcus metalli TaxID=1141878 RepID=A0A7W8NQM1_9DEIO|nr:DUF4394 domain-containing protein [Deinococcus metalli]MBB5376008.1 hypothetical protein [Deinococcus metalli]GHF41504.1 hypothetical protein GCM10017781_17750 [Deinococcus metalli]